MDRVGEVEINLAGVLIEVHCNECNNFLYAFENSSRYGPRIDINPCESCIGEAEEVGYANGVIDGTPLE